VECVKKEQAHRLASSFLRVREKWMGVAVAAGSVGEGRAYEYDEVV